jgi:hypothetical protein
MDTAAIRDRLKGHDVEAHPDRRLSISSQVIRADVEGDVVVAVGGDEDAGVQIAGLLDALHFWLMRRGGRGPLRYVVGSRESAKETRGVLQALAGLTEALAGEVDVRIELDFDPVALEAPDFADAKPEWLTFLRAREESCVISPSSRVRSRRLSMTCHFGGRSRCVGRRCRAASTVLRSARCRPMGRAGA